MTNIDRTINEITNHWVEQTKSETMEKAPWLKDLFHAIICLRRCHNVEGNWIKLEKIVYCHLHELNLIPSRWLNSILDSYVDHGNTGQKSNALAISSVFLMGMLLYWRSTVSVDGVIKPDAEIEHYDKFPNFLKRLDLTIKTEPLASIWKEIRSRIDRDEFSQIASLKKIVGDAFYYVPNKLRPFDHVPHRVNT